ncbi:MAG TPA: hypothetical protein VHE30_09520 [Polyangiaceae bacterium]|nr:hypothetical protein [Polyangiaceae bacterium]
MGLVGCGADDRTKGLAGAHIDGGLLESGGSASGGSSSSGGNGGASGGGAVGSGGTASGGTVGSGGTPTGDGGAPSGAGGNAGTGGAVESDAGLPPHGGTGGSSDAGSGDDDAGAVSDAGTHVDSGPPHIVLPDWVCSPAAATACGYPSLGAVAADDAGVGSVWGWVSALDYALHSVIPTLETYATQVGGGHPPACLLGRSWVNGQTVTMDARDCGLGVRGPVSVTSSGSNAWDFDLDVLLHVGQFVLRVQGALTGNAFDLSTRDPGLTVTDPDDASKGVRVSSFELKHDSGVTAGTPTHPGIPYDFPSATFTLTDATSCKSLDGHYGFDASSNFVITVTDGTTSGTFSSPIVYTPQPHVNPPSTLRAAACVLCSDVSTALSSVSCGAGGHERRLCVGGAVRTLEDCIEPVGCTAGSTKTLPFSCGKNDRGTITATCEGGAFIQTSCVDPDVCVDRSTRPGSTPCGNGSSYFQMCTTGQWVDTGVCLEDCGDVVPGSTAGSIQIISDADLPALAGVSQIAGDLTFVSYTPAVADWAASVRCVTGNVEIAGGTYPDFSSLRNLRSVGGRFRVDTETTAGDLTGLTALRFIGEALTVSGNSVTALSGAPALAHVGSVELTDSAVTSLAPLSALSGVESLSVVRSAVTAIPPTLGFLPSLSNVWLDANEDLADVSGLATLERACVSVFDCPSVTELPLSSLKVADCLTAQNDGALSSLTMPSLESMPGALDLVGLPALRTLDVGSLAGYVQSIQLDAVGLTDLSGFSTAQFSIAGNLSIRECAHLSSLSGLSGIGTIGLDLTITDNPVLTDVSALASTSSVGRYIEIGNSPLLPTCAVEALVAGWPLPPDVLPVSIYGTDDAATCP